MLPGAAAAASHPLNVIYNVYYLAFLGASMLPLLATLVLENGPGPGIRMVLRQILSASPLYFFVQSRCIGHYLSGEFASGGAAYIPTGRGLAIEHQPFHTLYSSFATSCVYPGIELLLFIAMGPLCSAHRLGSTSYALALLMPVALLYGPALFNPRCFEFGLLSSDFGQWVSWLNDDSPKGWGGHFKGMCDKKQGSNAYAVLLPSKEMIISFPLLLVAHEGMRPHGWGALRTLLLALPAAPLAGTLVGMLFSAGEH